MKNIYKLFTLFLILGLFTSCAELFQGKVAMSNTSSVTLGDLLLEDEIITQLPATTQVLASQGRYSNKISVTWTEVKYAVSYRLERAVISPINGSYPEPQEEDFVLIADSIFTNSYEDTILTQATSAQEEYNNLYYYRVAAENNRNNLERSDYTTSNYGNLFAPPASVSADLGASTDFVTIYWTLSNNAQYYEIYRSNNSNGFGAEKLATVTGDRNQFINIMTDTEQGKEFYYYIYAKNKDGNLSAQSSIALGYALVAGAPDQVKNVQVTEGRGTTTDSISISWNPVTAFSEVTYTIYRTSSLDSSLTLLGTTTSTNFTDKKSLKTNAYYYYLIQASVIDLETGEKLKGKISDSGIDSSSPAEGFIISPPSVLNVKKDSNGETFSWTPSIGNIEEQNSWVYEIYGDSQLEGTYETLLGTYPASTLTLEDGYYHQVLQTTTSFYKIKTINPNNSISSNLSYPVAPAPFAAKNLTVSKAANLSEITMIANSSGVYPVKITWEKPDNDNPAGYYLYRSTKPDSGFKKVTDEIITDTVYYDNNESAKAGKYYYYRVLSLNILNQGSYYSNDGIGVEGYGALTPEQYMREYNNTAMNSQKKLTLMHKPGTTDKLGTETANGDISGSLYYNASIAGLGGRVIMEYTNYADFYIEGDSSKGIYFLINGNTNTSAKMDQSGTMDGTVTCQGMYPGKVYYDNIKIDGGAAGGGTYGIEMNGFDRVEIDWTVGEN